MKGGRGKRILETPRLILREMTWEDYGNLCGILQDGEAMYAYEHAFSDEEVRDWLRRQLERYDGTGVGLWAVEDKATGEFLGQCGLTWQPVPWQEQPLLEVGYLFLRSQWHKGYAAEAAMACRDYAFGVLGQPMVCSIIRDTNRPSQRVAERIGMKPWRRFVKHYMGIDMPHDVYVVEKEGLV